MGSVTLSQFVIVVSANWRFREALEELVSAVSSLPEQSMHMDKVREFIEYQPATPAGHAAPPDFERFEMRDVAFGYGDGEDVLKGVSFSFQRGDRVALVGENGAGKSTLVKLMLGLYRPRRGRVLYNGIDIGDFEPKLYRARFGAVFQDYAVFAESAYDNIACGADGADAQARFDAAVEFADLRGKLDALPQGADTALSREFDDRGVNLSGGEQQKVAIAPRALQRRGYTGHGRAVQRTRPARGSAHKAQCVRRQRGQHSIHDIAPAVHHARRQPDTRAVGRAHKRARHA